MPIRQPHPLDRVRDTALDTIHTIADRENVGLRAEVERLLASNVELREQLKLPFRIEYRRKDGVEWRAMAAFDVRGPAESYLGQQSTDKDWPYEYRLVDYSLNPG